MKANAPQSPCLPGRQARRETLRGCQGNIKAMIPQRPHRETLWRIYRDSSRVLNALQSPMPETLRGCSVTRRNHATGGVYYPEEEREY